MYPNHKSKHPADLPKCYEAPKMLTRSRLMPAQTGIPQVKSRL